MWEIQTDFSSTTVGLELQSQISRALEEDNYVALARIDLSEGCKPVLFDVSQDAMALSNVFQQ